MRKLFRWTIFLAVIGLAAVLLRPSEEAVERQLKAQFLDRLAEVDPSATGNTGAFAVTLLCKADRNACYDLFRASMKVSYEDRRAYARVHLDAFGEDVTCYAAFTRLFCLSDLPMGG